MNPTNSIYPTKILTTVKLPTPEISFDDSFERRLFTRRPDLTETIRLIIANTALDAILNGGWGTITELANQYNISRTFVYSLANTLKGVGQCLFAAKPEALLALTLNRKRAIEMMLSIRLESCSSISGVSMVMKRLELDLSSTGSISQTPTQIGRLLPMTVNSQKTIQYLIFASDELFAKALPILVTVDPCSSAILRIELSETRQAEDWKKHFECLMDNGVEAIYLVSNDGKGLCTGHSAALSHTVRQSDTYHAMAHTLGSWVDRLEASAYKAIKEEHEREQKVQSARRRAKILRQIYTNFIPIP